VVSSPHFVVRVTHNELGHNRFGVIISAKVNSKSTQRHRLKRFILAEVKSWPSWSRDLILVVLGQLVDLSGREIANELALLKDELIRLFSISSNDSNL